MDDLDLYPEAMQFEMNMDCAPGFFWKANSTAGCTGKMLPLILLIVQNVFRT